MPSYAGNQGKARLNVIPGLVPDLRKLPVGCRFQERCARARSRLSRLASRRLMTSFDHGKRAACFHVQSKLGGSASE